MNSEASVEDQVSAPSLLGLPPEVRLEIYRHLLVHHTSIQPQILRNPKYYTGIQRAQRAISNTRSHPVREFSPETAILRTCRQIYLEAVSILYGENTFLYFCYMSICNNEDYIKVGFPDQNIHLIKHLEVEVHPKRGFEDIRPVSVAATIQYFASRGCELKTFGLFLEDLKSYDPRYKELGEQFLFNAIGVSDQVYAALVELQVLQSLSISLVYCQRQSPIEHEHEVTVGELHFPDMIKRLASKKNFKIMQEKVFDTDFVGYRRQDEDDDPDCHVIAYYISWCLRPQRSEVQTNDATI